LAETEGGCELSMKLLTLRRSLTLLENQRYDTISCAAKARLPHVTRTICEEETKM